MKHIVILLGLFLLLQIKFLGATHLNMYPIKKAGKNCISIQQKNTHKYKKLKKENPELKRGLKIAFRIAFLYFYILFILLLRWSYGLASYKTNIYATLLPSIWYTFLAILAVLILLSLYILIRDFVNR